MQSVSNANFGPPIAYLVPGATVLLGFSPFSPVLRSWFGASPAEAPTIGGFLYLTTASIAVGMTVSAIRWAVVDTMHSRTGLPLPPLDFSQLGKNVEAYALLIEIHYRHYLFYGLCGAPHKPYYADLRIMRSNGPERPLRWRFRFEATSPVWYRGSTS